MRELKRPKTWPLLKSLLLRITHMVCYIFFRFNLIAVGCYLWLLRGYNARRQRIVCFEGGGGIERDFEGERPY